STGDTVQSTLFLNSSPEEIDLKVKKHAFSGGKATVSEHREKGGDITVDISFRYLTFFEESEAELERIATEYKSGRMLTGELKQILINKLIKVFANHQAARATITD